MVIQNITLALLYQSQLKLNTMKKLQVRDWWGKKFTSKSELFDAANNNILEMKKEIQEFGSYYYFYNNGNFVASFYQDHTFGFCTQPYGIEVNNIHGNKLINY